jgi:hypothetical protein
MMFRFLTSGAFLLTYSKKSTRTGTVWFFKFQKIRFLTRDLTEALRIPAGSAWNIGLKSASLEFCFCCKMYNVRSQNELFCRFWFCGHEWMLCISHATCQQIPAQFATFFSNFAYWWPSDQSSVNVDGPVKICHVEMINCEKVRLPRQICNFLYFRGFTYGIQVFCFSKVLFSSFASPSRRIARIAI